MQVIQKERFTGHQDLAVYGIPRYYCNFSLKTTGFSYDVGFSDAGHSEIMEALIKEGIVPDSLQCLIDEEDYVFVQIGFHSEARALEAWHRLFDLQPHCLQF